jgi:hypothetical protein
MELNDSAEYGNIALGEGEGEELFDCAAWAGLGFVSPFYVQSEGDRTNNSVFEGSLKDDEDEIPNKSEIDVAQVIIQKLDQNENKRHTATNHRRKKRPKPQSGPQRPLSAYNLFFRDYRLQLINRTGGKVPFAIMGKEVGKKWKSLGHRERQVWEDKAELESDRYRQEVQIYKANAKKKQSNFALKKELPSNSQSQDSLADDWAGIQTEGAVAGGSKLPSKFTYRTEPIPVAFANNSQTTLGGTQSTNEAFNQSFLTMPFASTTFNSTSCVAATELSEDFLPEGFAFPAGLPPSGSSIPWPDASGSVKSHTIHWKVYAVKESEATSFLQQLKAEVSKAPLPSVFNNQCPPTFPQQLHQDQNSG